MHGQNIPIIMIIRICWYILEDYYMKDDKMMQYLRGTAIQQYKTDVGFRTLVECVNENMYIIPK